jgi:bacteriocin-like protein
MEEVQSNDCEPIADDSELTDDELKVVSGGAINHEIHAQGTANEG